MQPLCFMDSEILSCYTTKKKGGEHNIGSSLTWTHLKYALISEGTKAEKSAWPTQAPWS